MRGAFVTHHLETPYNGDMDTGDDDEKQFEKTLLGGRQARRGLDDRSWHQRVAERVRHGA